MAENDSPSLSITPPPDPLHHFCSWPQTIGRRCVTIASSTTKGAHYPTTANNYISLPQAGENTRDALGRCTAKRKRNGMTSASTWLNHRHGGRTSWPQIHPRPLSPLPHNDFGSTDRAVMQINRFTQYSVLAHGPSKFNTANFQKDNTYFNTVVPICTKPVFLTTWTTNSYQPAKVIKQPSIQIPSSSIFRSADVQMVQLQDWGSRMHRNVGTLPPDVTVSHLRRQ